MHVFTVEGMTCGHCVKAVIHAVQVLDGAAKVDVDLAKKQVRVDSSTDPALIRAAIQEEGYQAEIA